MPETMRFFVDMFADFLNTEHTEQEEESYMDMRFIPSLSSLTLKLMSRPKGFFDSFK